MSIIIDKLTEKQFNQTLSNRDKIRLALEEFGESEIYLTTDQLASKTGLSVLSTYQALYGMSKSGEIELLREQVGAKEKIIGIKLIRMEAPESINARTADRATASNEEQFQVNLLGKLPALLDYLNKKLAIEEAKEVLLKSGLSTDSIVFEENPLGEEAILLLQKLTETSELLNTTRFERDAANRNYLYYKNKYKEN